MRTLARWRRLSPARRSLLPRALLLVVCVRVGLLALPFGVVRRLLHRARTRTVLATRAYTTADIIWCISRAGRAVPGATCLTRALATEVLLARRGLEPAVCIGVRRPDRETLQAHAWVEVDGRILSGGGDTEQYIPLGSINGNATNIRRTG
jgi:transglutaminase superfamily protein